jgi:hypothetical protein
MRLAEAPPTVGRMEASPGFGTGQLFLADSRLVLLVLNHLRYQALHRVFGVSREQANLLTVILLAAVADGAYHSARRVTGVRPHVAGSDAALGAIALRDTALRMTGPSGREIPGFGALVVFAIAGAVAAPSLRRAAHGMHVAEQRVRAVERRVRQARIRNYVAARDRMRADAA